ncbi:hypothetical protein BTJ39_09740 [Izhakiella australiensis]|uniref:peptidylprolyl isomerase n=1 Tax=Izhakiella australiensis TaxID=1926881 RepID=A0A1S8YMM4_9GAMM|nr:FKBP-type peptidyl-prolyl cis-trans isomerase [Izhakiella australiensis]OON40168.1 hypothetical protein BTJ39_09740 [Izhakiella australiensis]
MRGALYLSIAASLSLTQLPLAAKADSAVPPLLRFAERYTAEHPPGHSKQATHRASAPKKSSVQKSPKSVSQNQAALQDGRRLQQQADEINALKQALEKAQKNPQPSEKIDLSAIATAVQKLRQLSGITSGESQTRQQIEALSQQLAQSQQRTSELVVKYNQLLKQRHALKKHIKQVRQQLEQQRAQKPARQAQAEQLKTLQQQLAKAQADAESAQSARQQQDKALKKVQEQLSQTRSQLEQLRAARQPSAKQDAAEIALMRKQLDEVNQQLIHARDDAYAGQQKAAEALKATREQLQKQLDAANQQLERTRKNADTGQQKSELALKNAQEQLKAQLNTANVKLDGLQKQLKLSRKDAESAVAERQKTAEALKAASARLSLLQNQLELLRAAGAGSSENSHSGQQSPDESHGLQKRLNEAQAKVADLQNRLNAVPLKNLPVLNPQILKNPTVRQGYAIGISLGAEILLLQEKHQAAGNKVDKNLILAGIIDAFNHQPKIDEKSFTKALEAANEANAVQLPAKTRSQQAAAPSPPPPGFKPTIRKQDRGFLDAYRKRKGVKKSPYGFWYEVLKPGIKPLKPSDTVAIVVEESLTNGRVINDMEKTRQMLSEKMSAYPPLFQEALSKLRSQGEMNLVVPPELAYGKKGVPPKIPPDATMVYHIRIAAVWPEGKAPKQLKR